MTGALGRVPGEEKGRVEGSILGGIMESRGKSFGGRVIESIWGALVESNREFEGELG